MSLQELKDALPAFAKDTKLNLSSVLTKEGAPGLNPNQIFSLALACAYSTKNKKLIAALESEFSDKISPEEKEATKAASSIMAMNNTYYRFLHLADDKEIGKLPAKLRMSVIGTPGVPKVDFEIYSLGISAINGCGMCINAHIDVLQKAGISREGIQSIARIASVINAAAQSLEFVS